MNLFCKECQKFYEGGKIIIGKTFDNFSAEKKSDGLSLYL